MIVFARALRVEFLKIRRTLALWMVVLAPAVVLLLQFMMFLTRVDFFARRPAPLWDTLTRNVVTLWGLLMIPFFITLETALLAQMEHKENTWKDLFALPVPRWAIYSAKLVLVTAMLASASICLFSGMAAMGALLPVIQPRLLFPAPVPWGQFARPLLLLFGASLWILTIHQWFCLRTRSFTAAAAFGMSAVVGSFLITQSQTYSRYYPWSYPLRVVIPNGGFNDQALWVALAGAACVALAGLIDFSRREYV
jgi:hypothetical protein